jgi:hypothetical protein
VGGRYIAPIRNVCDSFDDMIALAALCQALIAKLNRLNERGLMAPVLPAHIIEEKQFL